MNEPVRTVIFDMDGLMFDTERLYIRAYDYAGEAYGTGPLGPIAQKTIGMNRTAARKVWEDCLGEAYDEAAIRVFVDEFYADFRSRHHVPVKKGLYRLLEFLKENGFDMAVASSTSLASVRENLEDGGVIHYFKEIIGGDCLEASKPRPDIDLLACDRLKKRPQACYALEDSRNGVLAAVAAGCRTIMVPDIWQPDAGFLKPVTACLDDLDQVLDFIRGEMEGDCR